MGFMTAFGDLEHNLDIPGGILSASSDLPSSELSPQGVSLSLLSLPAEGLPFHSGGNCHDGRFILVVRSSIRASQLTSLIAPLQKQPGGCTKKSENYE